MDEKRQQTVRFEEDAELEYVKPHSGGSAVRTWVVVIAIALGMIAWTSAFHFLVGDRPRTWQHDALPYIPAESPLSTGQTPPTGATPSQVVLPPKPSPGGTR
jgi:hypothetical protein